MDDKIRELHIAGLSERRIAAQLGITRHRVRTALEGFRPPAPSQGDSWFDSVGLALSRAKFREGDDEQMPLAELAYDVAEWLDKHDDGSRDVVVSLQSIVGGVIDGSNPLVRIHARRATRLMDDWKGTRD